MAQKADQSALITCADCGHLVARSADCCPSCRHRVVRCRICEELVASADLVERSYPLYEDGPGSAYHKKCLAQTEVMFPPGFRCPHCRVEVAMRPQPLASHVKCFNCGGQLLPPAEPVFCAGCGLPVFPSFVTSYFCFRKDRQGNYGAAAHHYCARVSKAARTAIEWDKREVRSRTSPFATGVGCVCSIPAFLIGIIVTTQVFLPGLERNHRGPIVPVVYLGLPILIGVVTFSIIKWLVNWILRY